MSGQRSRQRSFSKKAKKDEQSRKNTTVALFEEKTGDHEAFPTRKKTKCWNWRNISVIVPLGFLLAIIVAVLLLLQFNPFRKPVPVDPVTFIPTYDKEAATATTDGSNSSSTSENNPRGPSYDLSQFPEYVGIIQTDGVEEELGCRGTFIKLSPYIETAAIITTAHCHVNDENATISSVYYFNATVGKMMTASATEFDVIPHPKFQFSNFAYGFDILLIIFKNRTMNHAACLPDYDESLPEEFTKIQFFNSIDMYRSKVEVTKVRKISNKECANFYRGWFKDIQFGDMFCADHEEDYTPVGLSGTSLTSWKGNCNVFHGIYSAGAKKGYNAYDLYIEVKPLDEMVSTFNLI